MTANVSFVERALDALFEYQEIRAGCEAIADPSQPVYLKRWFVVKGFDPTRSAGLFHAPRFNLTVHRRGVGPQIYLHKIMRSDADRELHDHPWDFVSLILWRGYREETEAPCEFHGPRGWTATVTKLRRKLPGMILWRRAEHRHRVHVDNGAAWTLVITSGKKRSWGFWRETAFIPWRKFIARKCEGDRAKGAL